MTYTSLKIAGLSALAVAMTAGAAFAGGGEKCDEKKKASMRTTAATTTAVTSTPQTAVLSTAKAKAEAKKELTFDEALALCQDKGASDLQACIDYKTGKTKVKAAR